MWTSKSCMCNCLDTVHQHRKLAMHREAIETESFLLNQWLSHDGGIVRAFEGIQEVNTAQRNTVVGQMQATWFHSKANFEYLLLLNDQ